MTLMLGAGRLHISAPAPCVPVPGVGVRIAFTAKAHWPVLGIAVPVAVRSLTALLRPEICEEDGGAVLVFKIEIEDMSVAGLPRAVGRKVTEIANRELVSKNARLSWAFGKTLSHSFRLPSSMPPLDSLDLTVKAGRVEVRSDGVRLAVSFDSAVRRAGVAQFEDEPSAPGRPAG
jgi:hypothetical protein